MPFFEGYGRCYGSDVDDDDDNHGLGGAIDITVHLREECRSGMNICEIKHDRMSMCFVHSIHSQCVDCIIERWARCNEPSACAANLHLLSRYDSGY